MRYRSLVPPAVLILVFTGGACDTEAGRARKAEQARLRQAREDTARLEAEQAPPTAEVLEQVRTAAKAFMDERHPDLLVEGQTLTPLTPNLFLVGVAVKDLVHENRYVAQLTAERLRDGDWGEDGEAKDGARLVWLVDYASEPKLRELAERHGFAPEMDRIRGQNPRTSWGRRSWLDDYLVWHYLFHRPPAYMASGGGFTAMPAGYRFQDPGHPISAGDAAGFQSAAAPTGGRSMVFLGGSAWRPPPVGAVLSRSGQAFAAGPRGSISGRVSLGGVVRGGFGAAGHAAGAGG
ncbi:MAG: hypothetical protein P4L36_01045 [Holophaga sp.]|nr:hypothetical protein [Holophaga sp.]